MPRNRLKEGCGSHRHTHPLSLPKARDLAGITDPEKVEKDVTKAPTFEEA